MKGFLSLTALQVLTGLTLATDLSEYLQVDDLDSGLYDEETNLPKNSCARTCVAGQVKTCYYKFELEPYTTLNTACGNCTSGVVSDCYSKGCVTADGVERAILTINRRMPSPPIQVCQGDTIVVDIVNKMPGRTTTIHWHGMRQKNHKFMDGVPMVTQCPIGDAQTFRYTFTAEDAGFYFYHSHQGLQKVDGLVGSLLVRQPRDKDSNTGEYDFELPSHVIVVQDWYHMVADGMFPGLRFKNTKQFATSYLIQGRGQFVYSNGTTAANTPYAEFNVTKGSRYVFRVVAGTCYECQYIFTIENHDLTVIEVDAEPIKPYKVNSLTMSPGERYTVVVNCNQAAATYWIQVRTVSYCSSTSAHQVALLKYKDANPKPVSATPTYKLTKTNNPGISMNPVNSKCTEESKANKGPCLPDLRAVKDAPKGISQSQPDIRLVWAFGFHYFKNNELFDSNTYHRYLRSPHNNVGSSIDGKVFMFPPSPILSQREDIPKEIFCPSDDESASKWNVDDVECLHVMKVPANKVVEIVAIDLDTEYDASGMSHSLHLHGYDSYMIENGVMPLNMTRVDAWYQVLDYLKSDKRKKIPSNPAAKDTWPLTAGGYAVVRIYTDNPGYWFFHCHFAYHLESGMAGVLQVGEHDTFPKPPANFPKCGSYLSS